MHAGGVARDGRAWILAGGPNAGKTTTTFHLVEAGFSFVCEEIAIIDSTTHRLQPFLQTPSLDGRYLERRGQHPGNSGTPRHGRFERLNEFVTRYLPDRVCSVPVPLQGILLPRFAPNDPSRVEELTPAAALTEFLGYCFEPKEDTEGFFDKVIRLLETHKVFRRRFDGTDSLMRDLDTVLQR